jgi:hypothetical protein
VWLPAFPSRLRFDIETPCFCRGRLTFFAFRYDDSDLAFVGRTEGSNKTSLFGWNSLEPLVGVMAEVIFEAACNSRPKKGICRKSTAPV